MCPPLTKNGRVCHSAAQHSLGESRAGLLGAGWPPRGTGSPFPPREAWAVQGMWGGGRSGVSPRTERVRRRRRAESSWPGSLSAWKPGFCCSLTATTRQSATLKSLQPGAGGWRAVGRVLLERRQESPSRPGGVAGLAWAYLYVIKEGW